MIDPILQLLRDERGQSILEYALIISLVSVAAFIALNLMGTKVNNSLLGPSASSIP